MESGVTVDQGDNNVAKAPSGAHSLTWVIGNIWVRGAIVSIPISAVIIFSVGIILGLLGFNMEALESLTNNKIISPKEFTSFVGLLLSFIFVFTSYIGIKWGCRVVVKKTYIDAKDFGKIGYWVGIISIVMSFLVVDMVFGSFILGVFLTPRLVKQWLTQLSSSLS